MRAKSYFSILIILLIALGLRSVDDSAPNQQIVLQFDQNDNTADVSEHTLALVKQQLIDSGANNIRVESLATGQLRITYYSAFNVEYIKELLSDDVLGYTSQNDKKDHLPSTNNYDFDIFEIQNGSNADLGFDGVFIQLPNQKFDQSFYPKVNLFATCPSDILDDLVNVAFQINRNAIIQLENSSYQIPEVRAGPSA